MAGSWEPGQGAVATILVPRTCLVAVGTEGREQMGRHYRNRVDTARDMVKIPDKHLELETETMPAG